MDFKQEVLDVLAEVCQDDIVKENPDIEIFEEGLLDSFGTVELLLAIENRFDILVPIDQKPYGRLKHRVFPAVYADGGLARARAAIYHLRPLSRRSDDVLQLFREVE